MFFKKLKNKTLTLFLTLIIPINTFAYSSKIIAGGETVGIKLNTNGILVVGSYEINGHDTLIESGLKQGDTIVKINNQDVSTIDSMVDIINNCDCKSLDISYIRDKNKKNTNLFGVLGHEIADAETGEIIDIKDGTIFDSKITGITRSSKGKPGEKNAILYSDKVNGTIYENTTKGIFGKYTKEINNSKIYDVATIDDIKLGDAKILTVLDGNEVKDYSIKILKINNTSNKLKNIEFEITDKDLLNKTNGIVQGMSGSPIIQDNFIIGAVTHVVVEDPHRGYGILITNMLEEAEN